MSNDNDELAASDVNGDAPDPEAMTVDSGVVDLEGVTMASDSGGPHVALTLADVEERWGSSLSSDLSEDMTVKSDAQQALDSHSSIQLHQLNLVEGDNTILTVALADSIMTGTDGWQRKTPRTRRLR